MIAPSSKTINVLVWNENVEETQKPKVLQHYPHGIHGAIYQALESMANVRVTTSTLDQPEAGLSKVALEDTDVLIWWSHNAYDSVPKEVTNRVIHRVLDGMGFIALHSTILSHVFRGLMGSSCSAPWRNVGEREVIWTVDPSHAIAKDVGASIELSQEEMYGEPFDVPPSDEIVFISSFEGGEVFRSGICYRRGRGRIFYFRPGHETYPTYLNPQVQRVLRNAVTWAVGRD